MRVKRGGGRSADGWLRPGPTPEQRRADGYVAVLMVAGALLSVTLLNSAGMFVLGPPPSWPEQVAWSVGIVTPLVWRRQRPEITTIVIAVLFIGSQVRANPDTQLSSGALFAAIYTLGAWGRDRRLATRIRVGVIVAMFGWLAVSGWMTFTDAAVRPPAAAEGPLPPLVAALIFTVVINVLFFGFAYFFGDMAWTSAWRRHELEVQAEALRQSQAGLAEQAVVRERVRIARELHDVVAHHVAVMGIQAGAARRVLDKDPVQASTSLRAVEQTARTAVEELRRLLGVLREAGGAEPDAPAGAAGIDNLERLFDGAREAGLTVRAEAFGDPVEVPESLSLTVYRVVQEALTNTMKHARARVVDVRIRYLARELEVDVADDGRATSGAASTGLGLIGMRERVAAHDGTVEAGPRTGGGFRVRARFPLPTRVGPG